MKRRTFLKGTVPVTVLPFLLNGLPVKVFGQGSLFESALKTASQTDRVLVLVQMTGGNDGLNTVIPLDQYANLTNCRSNIMIPDNRVLALNNSTITGLHPAMTGLQSLYNNQMMTVIQGVSYPDPNYSHFRATDIWLTGSDATTILTSGWIGRFLDQEYPDYPVNYPNSTVPDPLAIEIGSVLSTALQGPSVGMGISLTSTSSFYNLVSGTNDPAPNTPAGHELTYIRETSVQTQAYTGVIKAAALAQSNLSTMYPAAGTNPLADQLKIVAQLIGGGLQTKVYMVNIGSFDTHSAQVDSTDTTQGTQAKLLGQLSDAIAAFENDLQLMGKQDNVVGMTFSEFGRRIMSNASLGTDHGSSEPIILFGSQLKGGLIGTNPPIASNVGVNDNLPMQYDYRSVYASVLKGWFGISDSELDATVLATYPILDLFKTSAGIQSTNSDDTPVLANFPNPVQGSTFIKFSSSGGQLNIKLYDEQGKEIETMLEGNYPVGKYQAEFITSGLAPGIYIYTLTQGSNKMSGKMMVQ